VIQSVAVTATSQSTVKKRAHQIKGIVSAARALSVSRQHLWAVIRGKRLSPSLLSRWKDWKKCQ